MRRGARHPLPDLPAAATAARGRATGGGRAAGMTDTRDKFRPEPIPAAIPASERGYFAVAPEPARPGQSRLWLYGDGNRARPPRTILLTRRDVHGLRMFLADVERGKHGRGRPEPIPAAIPDSERGYFEVAPEPTRPGQSRLWLYGDGNR